ncbi:MAG: hypothetical protein M1834_002174 [Cirrosporium novae-zelandiae]|nr:MAG: hypothetical protein M1834_002174 [Cirrosporium novae-zelandiae]
MLPPIPRLEDYDISPEYGFLPAELPLEHLPNPYYKPWEEIIINFQPLILTKRIRQVIDGLLVLSTSRLKTKAEWRRAYMILGFMAHAYIWGGDMPEERIPPPITIPLLSTSSHLDLPPAATYAGLCLWNWRPLFASDPEISLSNLATLTTFTGSLDESWFYLVSTAIESVGAPTLPIILRAIAAARRDDIETVTFCLQTFAEKVDEVGTLLTRMYENCDPHVFYHRIRPFLAGSKNMADAGLPNGVLYDDGGPDPKYAQYGGGSNAQSSLIQFFDIALGVEHRPTGTAKPATPAEAQPSGHNFLSEMRKYMPGPHRRFLSDLSYVCNIRDFVHMHDTPENKALTLAYDAALAMLRTLRDKHLQIVTRYIVIKSRERQRAGSKSVSPDRPSVNTPINFAASVGVSGSKGLRGTGGTALLPFLKQARDETGEPAIDSWADRLLSNSPGARMQPRQWQRNRDGDDGGLPKAKSARLGKLGEHADGVMEVVGLAGTWTMDSSEGGICHW